MEIRAKESTSYGIRFSAHENEKEIARTYLYIMKNDLHDKPFGFLEDVFVEENSRGQGIGTRLVKLAIEEARKRDCYKIICTSRHGKEKVHDLYASLGFKNHGIEFRLNFE